MENLDSAHSSGTEQVYISTREGSKEKSSFLFLNYVLPPVAIGKR